MPRVPRVPRPRLNEKMGSDQRQNVEAPRIEATEPRCSRVPGLWSYNKLWKGALEFADLPIKHVETYVFFFRVMLIYQDG